MKLVPMLSKFRSKCSKCKQPIKENGKIYWDSDTKEAFHRKCVNAGSRDRPLPYAGARGVNRNKLFYGA